MGQRLSLVCRTIIQFLNLTDYVTPIEVDIINPHDVSSFLCLNLLVLDP